MNLMSISDKIHAMLRNKKPSMLVAQKYGLENLADALEGPIRPLAVHEYRDEALKFPPLRNVAIYAVRGSSEGWWIHVDLIYRSTCRVMSAIRDDLIYPCETVMIGKTLTDGVTAQEIASAVSLWEMKTETIRSFIEIRTDAERSLT